MDIGSLFLVVAVAVLAGMYISKPFFDRKMTGKNVFLIEQGQASQKEHQRSALLAERERLLLGLQELDFDRTLGKIDEADYPSQRAALLTAGALVLQQLDALSSAHSNGQPAVVQDTEDDELEALISARKRKHQEKTTGFCPKCGNPQKKTDRFCSRCGAVIDE